jgi:hypothetical protein
MRTILVLAGIWIVQYLAVPPADHPLDKVKDAGAGIDPAPFR